MDLDVDCPSGDVTTIEAEHLRTFIERYASLPILWDPSNSMYMNKQKRNTALDELVKVYSRMKPGASRGDVRRKINTLRSNYRKELNRIASSKLKGSEEERDYLPTSWVFYALHQFLEKVQQPSIGTTTAPVKRLREISCDDEGELQGKIEAELSPEPPVPSVPVGLQTFSPLTYKRQRLFRRLSKQNSYLRLNPSKDSTDEAIPTIARVWGEKLNRLDQQQRDFAEKAINDVLFEAGQGTLHRHSVKINEGQNYDMILP